MILLETLEILNRRLIEYYGKFENGEAHWRVIFAGDQTEKRWVNETKDGFKLLTPYVDEVPKYTYNRNKYILERLIPVPSGVQCSLINKISYEPLWTFEDNKGNPLPPKWEVIVIVINTVYKAAANSVGVKYKEDEKELNTPEAIEYRIKLLEEQLFGNESKIGDALAYDNAVGYGIRNRKDVG